MSSPNIQYSRLISALTKEQFDEVVFSFIQCYWNLDTVILVDGKGDGGNDVKIFQNQVQIKTPIQVTVEKKPETKLLKDLSKVQKLIKDNGYSNEFYFFCTHVFSETKQSEIIETARENHGIALTFIDSRFIASQVSKTKFQKLRIVIRRFFADILDSSQAIFSDEEKLKFDLILYGKETTEIKNKIFDSFILLELFKKRKLEISEIEKSVAIQFKITSSQLLCRRELQKLKDSDKIHFSGLKNNIVSLTNSETIRIENTLEDIGLEEADLINSVNDILEPLNLEYYCNDFISQLRMLFQNLHQKDFNEISGTIDVTTKSDSSVIKNFMRFVTTYVKDDKLAKDVAIDLISICKENDFIQRVSAGDLFTKLVAEPELETYLNITKRVIYLDTPVALHLMCVLYQESNTFNNVYYRAAHDLWRLIRNESSKIEVRISKEYIQEVSFHIIEGLKMIELYKHDFFLKLGKSNNVFLNFYETLSANFELSEKINSFSDFFKDFGFDYSSIPENKINSYVIEKTELFFEESGIKTFNFQEYYGKQIYSEIKREVELLLLNKNESRPSETIRRDILMACYLFDDNQHNDVSPFLLTWDNVFYEIRRSYHINHPKASFWHLFRPAKFLDHFSLISLRLDGRNLTQDILLIIETEFKLKDKVFSLKDTVVKVLDLKSESAIKFIQEIALLRQNEIYRLKEKPTTVNDPDYIEFTAVETLMNDLFHYFKNSTKSIYTLQDLKECTSNEGNLNLLIEYLRKEIEYFSKNNKWNLEIYNNLNTIIKWHKESLNPKK
jgi:hypothetical protein